MRSRTSSRSRSGRPAGRARGRGAERDAPRRRRRRSRRGGAGRLQRPPLGALALVPLPHLAPPRALAVRGEPLALAPAAARPRSGCTPAAAMLVGEHDFRAFTPTETQHQVLRPRRRAMRAGTSAATRSSSRSPPTRSCGTWCERSSGRCSSASPTSSPACCGGAPRSQAGSTAPPAGSTWSASATPLSREPEARVSAARREDAEARLLPASRGYDRARVRFPVVLFDLDGTVVDSGAIILASMRHATRTVLGGEIPDEALMAAVGGPGLEAQMRELRCRTASTSSSPSTARTTSRSTTSSTLPRDRDVLAALAEQGRRLGIVSAKRRSTVELAFTATAIGHLFDVVVGGDETAAPEARARPAAARARAPRRAARRRRLRRRLAVRHRGREGRRAVRGRRHAGAASTTARAARGRGRRSSTRPRSSLPSSDRRRAPPSCASSSRAGATSTTCSTTPSVEDADVRPRLRRARRARGGASRARHARLADPARRRAALGPVPEGAAPRADGLAREGHDRGGARQVGRRRPQAPRLRRAGRLRDRAEDRRARDQPHLRARPVRARRDPRRRHPGRGRDRRTCARSTPIPLRMLGDDAAGAARGARRGLPAALRASAS